MTPEAFTERARQAALPSDGAKALDPISAALLLAALTTVVTELVSHCMEHLLHKDTQAPSRIQRARLRWFYVGPAVRKAIESRPDAYALDPWAIEGQVMTGLLGAGKSLTAAEFQALKASVHA